MIKMSDSGQNAKELFAEALRIADPDQRRAFLDRICAGDEALRSDVDSLLKANEQVGDFMGRMPTLPDGEG